MSESNQVVLRYVEEAEYNKTPEDSPDWQEVRYTGETFSASPSNTTSEEIRSDRMISDNPVVSASSEGDYSIEFSPQSFDDHMAAVMCSDWDSGVLTTGTQDSSYTFEKEFKDINKFIVFTGQRASSMNLEMSYGSIITGSFAFMGAGASTPTTSAVGDSEGVSAPPLATEVYVGSSDVGSVTIDGESTDICISSISLTVDNQLRSIECIGSLYPGNQKKGTSSVTGSMEMYLDADTFQIYKDSLESAKIALEYTITDGTNSYTFLLPRLTLEVEAPQSGGLDSDVTLSASFTAIFDPTEETNLKITRDPASTP